MTAFWSFSRCRYHAYFPTPGAIKGRGKGGRKRPESPRQSEEAGEDAALGAAVLLAKKGTNARRKEYRHVMARADNGHTDDVFEGATAVNKEPHARLPAREFPLPNKQRLAYEKGPRIT